MATVTVEVGGHSYELYCKAGEEQKLRDVARIADEKAQEAMKSVGRTGEVRTLLFATILLADELQDLRTRLDEATSGKSEDGAVRAAEGLADRVEALAARLEKALAHA